MTRKDYAAIADIIKRLRLPEPYHRTAISYFIKLLRNDNPRFDDAKFFEACNYEPFQLPEPTFTLPEITAAE